MAASAAALSTAAVCTYDRFGIGAVDASSARTAIHNGSADRAAVIVLLRETRANIEALQKLEHEPSDRGEQARLALRRIQEQTR